MSDSHNELPPLFRHIDKTHHLSLILNSLTMLFVLAAATTADTQKAPDRGTRNIGAFGVTCEAYLPIGCSRLYARMISDGIRRRAAIYWIEPTPLREGTHFLRYGDFLFSSDLVQYRIDGVGATQSFSPSGGAREVLLPNDGSASTVVHCALAIVARMRDSQGQTGPPLEVGQFFVGAQDRPDHSLDVLAGEGGSPASGTSDVDLLNGLPYGRRYSKAVQKDGSVLWRAEGAMDGRPLLAVTIRPLADATEQARQQAFDPNSLGRWSLVPEAYHVYWSFSRRYESLGEPKDGRAEALALCDEMDAYLDMTTPVEVRRALDRLRLKTALRTDDPSRIQRAALATLEGLCCDETASPYIVLLELAEIASDIEEQYPEQAETWLQPLVAQALHGADEDASPHLQRLVSPIVNNKWYAYGRLVLDQAKRQRRAPRETIDALAEKLDISEKAVTVIPPDPNEAPPSVRRYLVQLDAEPPQGTIDMNSVRCILDDGLAGQFTDANDPAKCALVEGVIRSIRLCVGDGPFCGDRNALVEAMRRFSDIYLGVRKIGTPVEPILATFLALSFCDISTAEDHEALRGQYHSLAADLESQVNALLARYELAALVGPNDVAETFAEQEAIFRRYVDDPLWPTFRFPWTANERTRLTNKLKLRLEKIEPLLDEMSDKVRYRGVDERLKRRTVQEIAWVFQHLMVEAAFQRRPAYPGISTQYRGRHGFTAVIAGPFCEDRPKERFRAMKYFHLGHRLEEVVRAERELARPPRQADNAQESPAEEQGP